MEDLSIPIYTPEPLASDPTLEQIVEAKRILKAGEEAEKRRRADSFLVCVGSPPYGKGCGEVVKVKDTILVVETYWDDDPYNPRVHEGDLSFRCPRCGMTNRFAWTPRLSEIRGHFKAEATGTPRR